MISPKLNLIGTSSKAIFYTISVMVMAFSISKMDPSLQVGSMKAKCMVKALSISKMEMLSILSGKKISCFYDYYIIFILHYYHIHMLLYYYHIILIVLLSIFLLLLVLCFCDNNRSINLFHVKFHHFFIIQLRTVSLKIMNK